MAVSAPSAATAVAAARLALAETLLLKVGQVVQAIVVGKTAAGLTTLKIGDQIVQAQLPDSLPAGTTLQLAVKAGGVTPQLVVVSQTPPGQAQVTLPQNLVVTPLPPVAERPVANGESVQRVVAQVSQIESGVVTTAPVTARGAPEPGGLAARAQGAAPAPVGAQAETNAARPVPVAMTAQATPGGTAAAAAPAATNSVVSGAQIVPAPAGPVTGQTAVQAQPELQQTTAVVQPVVSATATLASSTSSAAPVASAPVQVATSVAAPGPQVVPNRPGEGIIILPPQPANAGAQVVQRSGSMTSPVAAPVAAEPEAQASNPLLVAQAAARPQATIADLPRAAPLPVAQAALTAAPLPATPQAALAQMMPEAMAKQNSIGPLLTSLAAVVAKAGALPEPILRAALGVLAQRIVATDGKIIAADLERAVTKSGVYLEATLAKAEPQPGDAKAALLSLRGALAKQLGETPPPVVARDAAPPPLKGLPLRAMVAGVPDLPDGPRDLARMLHGQTDAAVSRVKLMQMASLPDGDLARPANQSMRMELPFLIGHELVMAQIQIARDGARREADRKRGWTMRFALNFSATGEVGAEVGLLGTAVNVSLWAAEPETAVAMNAALPELSEALAALGLTPGAIRIRHGAPEPAKPESGRLLDSVS
ncbi:MAG: flagellar hook-length control protein FliK [Devosia sp.]